MPSPVRRHAATCLSDTASSEVKDKERSVLRAREFALQIAAKATRAASPPPFGVNTRVSPRVFEAVAERRGEMRSRPDPVREPLRYVRPPHRRKNAPVQPLSRCSQPSVPRIRPTVNRSALNHAWSLLLANGWSVSGAAEIVSALASLPVDAMQHSIGTLGAGPATLNSCAHNLPAARAYGDC